MGIFAFVFVLLFLIIAFIVKKEFYIYASLFLYLIMPEYCAISLGAALPTLTISRAILILLFLTTIIQTLKIDFRILKSSKLGKFLFVFFVTETIVLLAHLDVSQHIKDYLGFLLENILFLILFINNINTEEKLEKLIKVLVYMAGIISIFAIIETFTGINVAEFLDTGANTSIISAVYERLNVRRATFSLGHPICLAVFLGMILPCVMYCINKYNLKRYKVIFVLTLAGITLTISRGPIAVIFGFLLIYILRMKSKDKKKYILLAFISIICLIIACMISNTIRNTITGTFASVLREIGFDIEVDEDFGNNVDGATSRLNQWTALPNVLKQYPLFGGGSYYIYRFNVPYTRTNGRIAYLWSVDCEYLSVLLNKGIIGFIGIAFLYFGILIKTLFIKDEQIKTLKYSLLIALGCYFTVCQLTTVRIFWVILSMIFVRNALINNEKKKGTKK